MSRPILLAALAAAAVAAWPAAAEQPTGAAKTVTAFGTGTATVELPRAPDAAARRKALADAEAGALRKAVAAARTRAKELASATGLTLGEVQAVEDVRAPAVKVTFAAS